jgi:hypothetical protein
MRERLAELLDPDGLDLDEGYLLDGARPTGIDEEVDVGLLDGAELGADEYTAMGLEDDLLALGFGRRDDLEEGPELGLEEAAVEHDLAALKTVGTPWGSSFSLGFGLLVVWEVCSCLAGCCGWAGCSACSVRLVCVVWPVLPRRR